MLRRIIRETIEEETRHSVNEGFMDSVKGMFGGGTKGAAKKLSAAVGNKIFTNQSFGVKSGSDWYDLKVKFTKVFGGTTANKFNDLFDAEKGSPTLFMVGIQDALKRLLKDPGALTKDNSFRGDSMLEAAEALENGDFQTAENKVATAIGRGDSLFQAFSQGQGNRDFGDIMKSQKSSREEDERRQKEYDERERRNPGIHARERKKQQEEEWENRIKDQDARHREERWRQEEYEKRSSGGGSSNGGSYGSSGMRSGGETNMRGAAWD
jgi:hypothetical protein